MALSKVDLANQVENQLPQSLVADNVNFRNLMINGDMSIAQRGTSFSSVSAGNGTYPVDRFRNNMTGAGTWTISQDTTVPTGQGFAKSVKYDCTTADASLAAGDFLILQQLIEGKNLQYLKKGTSSAESLTVSFWVRSNKTGTYISELYDEDNARNISQSYTISSANTWEKKTITFDGDTSGVLNNDNGASLTLNFWLAAGSTYSSGTLNTSWNSVTAANRAVGQVNLADNTANEWYVTGVQLEAGTSASDFEFLPYDVNLERCQRYYQTYDPAPLRGVASGGANAFRMAMVLPKEMRSIPSASTPNNVALFDGSNTASSTGISTTYLEKNSVELDFSIGSSFSTAGKAIVVYNDNGTRPLNLSSEL